LTTQLFKTTDTGLATFLIVSGHRLAKINYENPRYEFFFEDTHGTRLLADSYIAGTATTNPAGFLRINKKLLRVIHSRAQWEED